MTPVLWALAGGAATFAATALGSASVFLFKRDMRLPLQRIFLGFAAGIMLAACVWSLLMPSVEMAAEQGIPTWLPSSLGLVGGAVVLLVLDKLIPHEHVESHTREGIHSSLGKRTMFVLAVTLHNIPEGFAVGLTFAVAAGDYAQGVVTLSSAFMLALGMCIQNLPEGAAISLPLHDDGLSRGRAFLYGTASGVVEPIAAVVAALLADIITAAMPWLLAFAAGAMLYVIIEELIPEAHLGEHSHTGTFSVIAGFILMMVLELATT